MTILENMVERKRIKLNKNCIKKLTALYTTTVYFSKIFHNIIALNIEIYNNQDDIAKTETITLFYFGYISKWELTNCCFLLIKNEVMA